MVCRQVACFNIFIVVTKLYFCSGVHHNFTNCEPSKIISQIEQGIRLAMDTGNLFPKSLSVSMSSIVKEQVLVRGNGGWGDIRDHTLCLNMTRASFS